MHLLSGRRKSPLGLSDGNLQSAARRISSPRENKFHTCSLKSILRQVHALTQNVFDFVFRLREKFCDAFLQAQAEKNLRFAFFCSDAVAQYVCR